METKFTLNSGTNKGNRRIWIEGKRLADAGFTRGDLLEKRIVSGKLLLLKTADSTAAKHRIAGNANRPILDLCGKWVTAFMLDEDKITVLINVGVICIIPGDNA